MNSQRHSLRQRWLCLVWACGSAGISHAQSTQAEAFNAGKDYKSQLPALKNSLNAAALTQVPGQDNSTTGDLKTLYGTPLLAPGQNKLAACATYLPGTDAYKNAECDSINYVSGNAEKRPQYTIDRLNDPVLIRSSNVRNMPEANTAGATGLTGAYTACINQTSQQPERSDTQRCQVGRPVTESACHIVLKVSYTWESYAQQSGADLRYARCGGNDVRGDRLTIPLTDTYPMMTVECKDRGHGSGIVQLYMHRSCTGNDTLLGYDASACSLPPTPAIVKPVSAPPASCTDAPRTPENCFSSAGQFTTKSQVPVFRDSWDDSACADLLSHGAVIAD